MTPRSAPIPLVPGIPACDSSESHDASGYEASTNHTSRPDAEPRGHLKDAPQALAHSYQSQLSIHAGGT